MDKKLPLKLRLRRYSFIKKEVMNELCIPSYVPKYKTIILCHCKQA